MKHARGRLKLTQTELANLLGVSRRTVAEWEASGDGALSAQIAGRLSTVFTDMQTGPAPQDAPPLATVSDLELVTEMGRRLSSLRSQLDALTSDHPGGPAPQPGEPTQTGQSERADPISSTPDVAAYSGDPATSGVVGVDTSDADGAHDAPRFTDRQPGAC